MKSQEGNESNNFLEMMRDRARAAEKALWGLWSQITMAHECYEMTMESPSLAGAVEEAERVLKKAGMVR